MTPGKFDITITRGTTVDSVVFQFPTALMANLTGWTAFAEVRHITAGTVIIDLTPTITDAANRIVSLRSFTDEQTTALTAGAHFWDLLLEDGAGEIFGVYIQGAFNIIEKITLSS